MNRRLIAKRFLSLTFHKNVLIWLPAYSSHPKGSRMTVIAATINMLNIKNIAGLSDAQRHPCPVSGTRGSGWYDQSGSWVGWGDLTHREMATIAETLAAGERFIILHEEDSFRRFLRSSLPSFMSSARNEDAPGINYVATHALFIIEPRFIFRVDSIQPNRGIEECATGVNFQFIGKLEAKEKILTNTTFTLH